MKFLSIVSFLFLFSSCNYFGLKKEITPEDFPIASIFDEELYRDALQNLIPTNISKEDSLVLVKSIINNWAVKQLMLKKSLENNSSQENTAINELVENYKHSLLINNYKEQLIKQQLDTIISEAEIDTYYSLNKQNFKLNEELLKIKFLNFNNNLINKKEVVALFKSDALEDSEALENYHLNFKSFQLNDSVWIPLDNIMLKIPFSKEKLLK
jgi:hypothetical protein